MSLLHLSAIALGLVAAEPALPPEPPGTNPIIRDIFSADPAALVVGDRVYLYAGRDVSTNDKYNMPEWRAYSSSDMKTWQAHGVVLKPTDFKWARSDAYASQVVEKDGKFYFYATAKHNAPDTAMAIGVAVSDSPTGPFVDARGTALITNAMTPEAKHDWSDIDPTVFTDHDGTSWLMWGNEKAFIVKLKPNMIELDGPITQVDLPHYTEGPWLHKRGDTYYVTYASWDKGAPGEYISYATAKSVQGPWTYRGQLTGMAESSNTIHPAIIDFKGQWYFFYHDGTLSIDGQTGSGYRRNVRVEPLYYNADGTIKPIVQTKAGVSILP